MSDHVSTSSSVSGVDTTVERVLHWLLFRGNRLHVALLFVGFVLVVFQGLEYVGVVAVGPNSSTATAFGSGLLSGTLTVVTVALSINQLILSRVFGSPNELRDRLDGTRDLRRLVQTHADEPATPNDPAAFLRVVARTLASRARQFESRIEGEAESEVKHYISDIAEYGENIDESVSDNTTIVNVLDVIIGTEYAQNMTATEYIVNRHGEGFVDDARTELDAVDDLLEAIAISRQFFKTISLQQDFARLSRMLAYSGLIALLASLVITLFYRADVVTIGPALLPWVVGLGVAIIVTPLALFISYILRAATIARRTVSVGPFVPSEQQSSGE